MRRKFVLFLALGFVAALAVLGDVGFIYLSRLDLGATLERRVSAAIDRRVSIGSIKLVWGSPLSLQLTDLRIANAPWGGEPDMVVIDRLSADVAIWPLLRGVVRYDNLRVGRPMIVLERNGEGVGNWHFAESHGPSMAPWAIVPKDRTQFPTLIDFMLNDGFVSYRTSSGHMLKIALHSLAIRTDGDDRPATLSADVDYNGTPGHVVADTNSFSVMRKGSVPFGARISIETASGSIDFDGTMMDPLNIGGATGNLRIDAKNLGKFLNIFDAGVAADMPMTVDSPVTHDGDRWQLADAKGSLNGDPFAGTVVFDEGARHEADHIALDVNFTQLDLKRLAGMGKAGETTSLRIDPNPSTTFDVRVTAKQVQYGKASFSALAIDGHLQPGEIAVDDVSMIAAGGMFKASAKGRTVDAGSQVDARMDVVGVESGEIARWLGAEDGQLEGTLDAHVSLKITGATLNEALGRSTGQVGVSMTGGQVARSLLERASTNLRALFRKGEGTVPLTCVVGVGDLRDGVITFAPVRLRTPATTLVSGGNIDLRTERVDMTLRSTDREKSLLTLNLPLHIGGPLSDVRVSPLGTKPQPLDLPMDRFTPDLRQLAASNPCLR